MNQSPDRPAGQISRGLAYVCHNLDYVRSTIAGRPATQRAALINLTDTTSADLAADLETVHRAIRSAGDPLGVFGQNGVRDLAHAVGIDREDRTEPVLRCPRQQHPCARYAQPGAGTVPRCELTGGPLKLGEL